MFSSRTPKASLMLVLIVLVVGLASVPSYVQAAPIGDFGPALKLLAPVNNGVGAGMQNSAGNIDDAVANLDAGRAQSTSALGDTAANTLSGVGQTVGRTPGAAEATVHTIDRSHGLIGGAVGTIFGH